MISEINMKAVTAKSIQKLVDDNKINKMRIGKMVREVRTIAMHEDMSVSIMELPRKGIFNNVTTTYSPKNIMIDLQNKELVLIF